jgi:hypothetical protein
MAYSFRVGLECRIIPKARTADKEAMASTVRLAAR